VNHASRIDWIDIVKGIGAVCVVAGHVHEGPILDAMGLWRMPVFFFLSGLLFRPRDDLCGYARDKARHLLLPYASFLALLLLPALSAALLQHDWHEVGQIAKAATLGGHRLAGPVGIFWFITCLYLTQQIAAWLFPRIGLQALAAVMLATLCAAYAWAAAMKGHGGLPWSADVVLMALPIFYLGWRVGPWLVRLPAGAALVTGGVAVLLAFVGVVPSLDMKQLDFGAPFVSLLASVVAMGGVIGLARLLVDSRVGLALAALGRASLVVMFLHQAVQLGMQQEGGAWANLHARVLAGVILPWMFYLACERFALTRLLFLGQGAARAERSAGRVTTVSLSGRLK
jgi:fucose 4-O-acetylase-like acetyltransferase